MGIPISIKRVRKCISQLQGEFTSADILRGYIGHFHRDKGAPAATSFNAQFGKWLRKNKENLGIKWAGRDKHVIDDAGGKTRAVAWRKVRE